MMMSGLVLNDEIKWISFHSKYDFGYLLKTLTCSELPMDETGFLDLLFTYFPCIYDVKVSKAAIGRLLFFRIFLLFVSSIIFCSIWWRFQKVCMVALAHWPMLSKLNASALCTKPAVTLCLQRRHSSASSRRISAVSATMDVSKVNCLAWARTTRSTRSSTLHLDQLGMALRGQLTLHCSTVPPCITLPRKTTISCTRRPPSGTKKATKFDAGCVLESDRT